MSNPFQVISEPTDAVKALGAIDRQQGSGASPFLASERLPPSTPAYLISTPPLRLTLGATCYSYAHRPRHSCASRSAAVNMSQCLPCGS